MTTKIIPSADHLEQKNYNGSIQERKVVGFSHENSPVKPYSNVFYWSHLSSNFGSVIAEHPHIGFEMVTYVIKGSFETFDKVNNKWHELQAGDVSLVQAGKGICHCEKINPRSEVLQIWFDPDYDHSRKLNPASRLFKAENFPVAKKEGSKSHILSGEDAPIQLHSKDVSLKMIEFSAGFHSIKNQEDTVLSGYVLDGFIEIDETVLSKGDFFLIEKHGETKIASLVNSKIFLASTPFQPQYQLFSEESFNHSHA